MKISLTKIEMYDLEINGTVFKGMRQTGKLEGIIELSNGTSTATLCRTTNNRLAGGLSEALNKFFNDGKDEAWMPIRGTPDIQKAMEIKVVDDRFVTGTGSAEAKVQLDAHAGGGQVNQGKSYLVGEKGPDLDRQNRVKKSNRAKRDIKKVKP